MFDRKDFLEKNLERQIGFVRASETRIRFLLPALSVTLAIWFAGFQKSDFSDTFTILTGVLSIIGFLLSYYFAWEAMFPDIDGPKNSLIFFGGIASRSKENFQNEIEEIDEETYLSDLSDQTYINAKIATRKFKATQKSMMFWYFSLIPLTIFLIMSLKEIKNGS